MIILALDIAKRKTGWAVDSPAGPRPLTGTFTMRDGLDLGDAGLTFCNWLSDMIAMHAPGMIVSEAPALGGRSQNFVMNGDTSRALIGLQFSAMTMAAANRLRREDAHVTTWRKHFLGHGRPPNPKKATMDRCRLLGWEVKDDNAADAAGLWAWAKATYDKSFRLETATPMFAGAAA